MRRVFGSRVETISVVPSKRSVLGRKVAFLRFRNGVRRKGSFRALNLRMARTERDAEKELGAKFEFLAFGKCFCAVSVAFVAVQVLTFWSFATQRVAPGLEVPSCN